MMRRTAQLSGAIALLLLQGMCLAGAEEQRAQAIDSLKRAARFVASKQDADGAWRSGVHGSFKDGQSLTPLVATNLMYLQGLDPSAASAFAKADAYLFPASRPEPLAMSFPLYTHSMCTWIAAIQHGDQPERVNHHLAALRNLQLNSANGWDSSDLAFGGWGYHHYPKKPSSEVAVPWGMPESNISATVFAIGALKFAKVPADDPAWRDAKVFVLRCQNYSDDASRADKAFDDGGFVFTPDDPATSKPGAAGTDRFGRVRLHSYGSATADGVRCLLQSGFPRDHARVVAAKTWLITHFDATLNPGDFNADRKSLAIATKYYWLWSIAHAMRRLEVNDFDWRTPIINELLKLQREDGSWKNDLSDGREDDPLVATSFAMAALYLSLPQ